MRIRVEEGKNYVIKQIPSSYSDRGLCALVNFKHYHAKALRVYPNYVLFKVCIFADEVQGVGKPKPFKVCIQHADIGTQIQIYEDIFESGVNT